MAKTFRIPFSRVRAAGLRRSMMLLGYPVMLACNWLLILWAAALSILQLALAVMVKVIAAPFQLAGESFAEAWHGRGPGSDRATTKQPTDKAPVGDSK